MVDASLVPGRIALPYYPVMCCLHHYDVPYPFTHLGGTTLC
jgi:hypothetical protein